MRSKAPLWYALAGAAWLLPLVASAAGNGLVPCSGVFDCNLCTLVKLVQDIIDFAIGISIPIAAALFAYAGLKYFTSAANPGQIKEALQIFRTTAIGFLIAIAAWVIVDVLLHAVIKPTYFNDIGGNWYSISCIDKNQNDQQGGRQISGSIRDWIKSFVSGSSPSTQSGGGQSGGLVPGTSAPSGGSSTGGGTGEWEPVAPSGPTSGAQTPVTTVGPDGTAHTINLPSSGSPDTLAGAYNAVNASYGSYIQNSCQSSSLPNCQETVAAVIAAESGGDPTRCNGNSCGIMQLNQANGGSVCASSDNACIAENIAAGTKYLDQQYERYPNLPNALAAYNSGGATAPGQGTNGGNTAMVTSSGDPSLGCGSSYYAWQCSTQPGGLTQTQQYVAKICQTLTSKGVSC